MGRIFDGLTQGIMGGLQAMQQTPYKIAQIELEGERYRDSRDFRNKQFAADEEQRRITNARADEEMRIRQEEARRAQTRFETDQTNTLYKDMDRVFGPDGKFDSTAFDSVYSTNQDAMNRIASNYAKKLHPEAVGGRFVQIAPGRYGFEFIKADGSTAVMDEKRSKDPNSRVQEFTSEELNDFFNYTRAKAAAFTALPKELQTAFEFIAEQGINDKSVPEANDIQVGLGAAYQAGGPAAAEEFVRRTVADVTTPQQGFQDALAPGQTAAGVTAPVTPVAQEQRLAAPGFAGGFRQALSGVVDPSVTGIDYSKGATKGQTLGTVAGTLLGILPGALGDAGQLASSGVGSAYDAVSRWGSSEAIPAKTTTPNNTPAPKKAQPAVDMGGKGVLLADIEQRPEEVLSEVVKEVEGSPNVTRSATAVTERIVSKGGSPKDNPKQWARHVGALVKHGIIDGNQGVRMLQTGFTDLMAMNMSVFHEDRALAKKTIEIQEMQAAAKQGEAELKAYRENREKFNNLVSDELKTAFPEAKFRPADAEYDFHQALAFMQVSTVFDPRTGRLTQDPARARNFATFSPGVVAKSARLYDTLRSDTDGVTAATLALMATERTAGKMGEMAIDQLTNLAKSVPKGTRAEALQHHVRIWGLVTDNGAKKVPIQDVLRKSQRFMELSNQVVQDMYRINPERAAQLSPDDIYNLLERGTDRNGNPYRSYWDN